MKVWRKGEITVFVSFMLAVLLLFFQICLRSAQFAYLRSQTQEALELAEMSVLSEYHRKLLERYDLFYLDLGYGTGIESEEYLKQRICEFLDVNLGQGGTKALEIRDICRATDEKGMNFYEQAVSHVKQKTGLTKAETFRMFEALGKTVVQKESDYAHIKARETANMEELKKRAEKGEQEEEVSAVIEAASLKKTSVLHLLIKEPGDLSGKKANLQEVPSARVCLEGAGIRGQHTGSMVNDAFFHIYLQEHFSNAADFLEEKKDPGSWLDYQLEYILAGKESDIANLEYVCSRLLAMREGINYAYLLTDEAKVAECEVMAAALAGVILMPELIEVVKQVLLLTWAFAESVEDVRLLLGGKRVNFWKSADTWRTSLTGALDLQKISAETQEGGDGNGLSYEEYLCILLTMSGREKKTMRSLDVIEGVLREESKENGFYLDQCVDSFWVDAVIFHGQEWSSKRWFCYEW